MKRQPIKFRAQAGATLIVALVILAVVTVLGIASIRSSNLELKMAASQRDRSIAFQTAESALKKVEQSLIDPAVHIRQLTPGCSGEFCFVPDCSGKGYCFNGHFDATGHFDECKLASDAGVARQYWDEPDRWTNAPTIDVPKTSGGNAVNKVKYLVEFMCFVPRDDLKVQNEEQSRDSMVPLFRVSVQAEGEANRSTVMLQSVFRGRLTL